MMSSECVVDPTIRALRYDAGKKSVGVAYLLWFFFGLIGVHRFYLGEARGGAIYLASFPAGFIVHPAFFAVPFLFGFVDMFCVPGLTRTYNQALITRLT